MNKTGKERTKNF